MNKDFKSIEVRVVPSAWGYYKVLDGYGVLTMPFKVKDKDEFPNHYRLKVVNGWLHNDVGMEYMILKEHCEILREL